MNANMDVMSSERVDQSLQVVETELKGLLNDFRSELKSKTQCLSEENNALKTELQTKTKELQTMAKDMQTLAREVLTLTSEVESLQTENQSLIADKEMIRKELRELRHENDQLVGHKESVTKQALEAFAKVILQNSNINGIVNSLPAFSEQMVLSERPNSMTAFDSLAQMDGMRMGSNQSSNENNRYHSSRLESKQTSKETTSDDTYYDANSASNRSSLRNDSNDVSVRPKAFVCQQNQISSTVSPTQPTVSGDKLNDSVITSSNSSSSFAFDENNNLKLKAIKVPIGRMVGVSVAYITSPSSFWLHINSSEVSNYIHVIQVKQEELAKTDPKSKLTTADVEVGMYCAAIYSADHYWYRAQVTGIIFEDPIERDSIKTVSVLYIDWGNCEEVPLSRLMRLHPELKKRRQALHCYLQSFGTVGTKWPEKTIHEFKETVESKRFNASFHKAVKLNERIESIIYPIDLVIVFSDGSTENIVNFLPNPVITDESFDNEEIIDLEEHRKKSDVTFETVVCNGPNLQLSAHSAKSLGNEKSGSERLNPRRTDKKDKSQSDHNCAANAIQCNGLNGVSEQRQSVPKSAPQLNVISDQLRISAPIVPDSTEGLIVNASHLINPSHFYLQINDTQVGSAQFENLEERLNQYYVTYIPARLTQAPEVTVGSFWSCQFSEDQDWYRGRVVAVTEDKALINYVDYGNEEWVDFKCLMPLTRQFANYPALAVRCGLSNIFPVPTENGANDWSFESSEYFRELILDNPLTAFVANKPKDFDFDSTLDVFLWTNDSKGKDVLTNSNLVVNQFAITDNNEWVVEAERAQREMTPPEVMCELIPKIVNVKYYSENGGQTPTVPQNGCQKSTNRVNIVPELLAEEDSDDGTDNIWDPMKEDANCDDNIYNMRANDPGVATTGFDLPSKKTCKFYNQGKGCRLDEYCSFLHVEPDKRFVIDDTSEELIEIEDLELDVDSYIPFKVTSISSPSSFFGVVPYGQIELTEGLNKELEDIHKLSVLLKDKYSGLKAKENPNIFPGIGSVVAYRDESDGNYFRGRIIKDDPDSNVCTIFNIDLAFNVDVRRSWVFKLDPYFCQFPAMAVHCSLFGIEPFNGNGDQSVWSEQAIQAFGDWTLNRLLYAHIVYGQTDGKHYVELIESSDQQLLISEKLVEYKFAQKVTENHLIAEIATENHLTRTEFDEEIYDSDLD